ncbi:MAG: phage tail assembly chaperone [Proteobacteria bacterium]|nr:phage tail assembly chaperone [Pseudomonadota bacterium]
MGGNFADSASHLAGLAGLLFGWSPGAFWAATPAELAALVDAARGDDPAPVDLAALMEMFPDG